MDWTGVDGFSFHFKVPINALILLSPYRKKQISVMPMMLSKKKKIGMSNNKTLEYISGRAWFVWVCHIRTFEFSFYYRIHLHPCLKVWVEVELEWTEVLNFPSCMLFCIFFVDSIIHLKQSAHWDPPVCSAALLLVYPDRSFNYSPLIVIYLFFFCSKPRLQAKMLWRGFVTA